MTVSLPSTAAQIRQISPASLAKTHPAASKLLEDPALPYSVSEDSAHGSRKIEEQGVRLLDFEKSDHASARALLFSGRSLEEIYGLLTQTGGIMSSSRNETEAWDQRALLRLCAMARADTAQSTVDQHGKPSTLKTLTMSEPVIVRSEGAETIAMAHIQINPELCTVVTEGDFELGIRDVLAAIPAKDRITATGIPTDHAAFEVDERGGLLGTRPIRLGRIPCRSVGSPDSNTQTDPEQYHVDAQVKLNVIIPKPRFQRSRSETAIGGRAKSAGHSDCRRIDGRNIEQWQQPDICVLGKSVSAKVGGQYQLLRLTDGRIIDTDGTILTDLWPVQVTSGTEETVLGLAGYRAMPNRITMAVT